MASTKKPVQSEQMKKVYLRRRLVVAAVLLTVIVAVISLVWAAVMSVSSVQRAVSNYVHRDELTALNREEVPDTILSTGISDCTAEQVALSLKVEANAVTAGGSIKFTAQIQHAGKTPCLIDGSDASRVLTISSGDETIWTSALCSTGSRSLLMSDDQKDIQTLTWNTAASSTACGAAASTPAAAGTYKARLSLRDLPEVTSDEVAFTVAAAPVAATEDDGDDADAGDAGGAGSGDADGESAKSGTSSDKDTDSKSDTATDSE